MAENIAPTVISPQKTRPENQTQQPKLDERHWNVHLSTERLVPRTRQLLESARQKNECGANERHGPQYLFRSISPARRRRLRQKSLTYGWQLFSLSLLVDRGDGPRRRSTAALTGDTPGVSTADIFHNLASLERAGDRLSNVDVLSTTQAANDKQNPERTHIASDNRELRKRTQGAQLLTNSPALHANQFQVQVDDKGLESDESSRRVAQRLRSVVLGKIGSACTPTLSVEKHSAFRVGAVSSVGLAIVARLRVAVGVRRYRAAQ
ncbi:hypothetical protein BDV98DRAFT_583534 [Pterulicium gracile]|uniref:Uncharacterized protein n=1 Tax=Pterulicium gracile TaxID=1884261 RepID=A0A5C3QGJ5_9AGAR|nr:hypothetical protein BDV98DRAFT_583534 [Pterula gracilis]